MKNRPRCALRQERLADPDVLRLALRHDLGPDFRVEDGVELAVVDRVPRDCTRLTVFPFTVTFESPGCASTP